MKKYIIFFVTLFLMISYRHHAQTILTADTLSRSSNSIQMNKSKATKKPNNVSDENLVAFHDEKTKAVFFVHGLAGSNATWSTPRRWTKDNYNAYVPPLDYSYSTSLENAASDLGTIFGNQNHVLGEDYSGSSSIFIAHSMGGNVAQQMNYKDVQDQKSSYEYGAIATFGSPLAGAPVVKNDECFEDLIAEGCKVMTDAKVSAFFQELANEISSKVSGFLKGILNKAIENTILKNTDPIVNVACDKGSTLVFGFLRESILPNIGRELDPDGDVIATLKKHEVDVPSLAFWGIEEDPVSLRQIYSLEHDVNIPSKDKDNPNPPSDDEFTADYDDGYIDAVNDYKDELESQAQFWRNYIDCKKFTTYSLGVNSSTVIKCNIQGGTLVSFYTNGLFSKTVCEYCFITPKEDLAKKFDKAAQWLRDFDNNYRICFGLDDYEFVQKTVIVCNCYIDFGGPVIATYNKPCEQLDIDPTTKYGEVVFDCKTEDVVVRVKERVKQVSDGVVPANSAKKINVKEGIYFKAYDMKKSNHQQMRNDKNAGFYFDKMFGGEYDPAFKLDN